MLFDLSLDQLMCYQPPRVEPTDFDAFWQQTLDDAQAAAQLPRFEPIDTGLKLVQTFDVTFSGYAGQPIKAWLLLPAAASGPLPCVVEYTGYGGGRGHPLHWLLWSNAGYAHLVMDTRGQGSDWRTGDTPDIEPDGGNPHYPGFMTRGILKPHMYYYRRVFTDAVRAVETARQHPAIDCQRIAVAGGSQGGGIALAVAGLTPDLAAAIADVPFLCHFRRAAEITDAHPYYEIVHFCRQHRDKVDTVFQTLAYFDGVNFAARASCPSLFSVGLMDEVCPPSTVFAAYNHYAGPKRIDIWPFNHHEGGEAFQDVKKLQFLAEVL